MKLIYSYKKQENESYEDIKIKDILDLSGVSRQTFYRHFANKNELLNHYFEQIINISKNKKIPPRMILGGILVGNKNIPPILNRSKQA